MLQLFLRVDEEMEGLSLEKVVDIVKFHVVAKSYFEATETFDWYLRKTK